MRKKLEVENPVGLSREVILISVNDGTAQLYCRSKGQYHVVQISKDNITVEVKNQNPPVSPEPRVHPPWPRLEAAQPPTQIHILQECF